MTNVQNKVKEANTLLKELYSTICQGALKDVSPISPAYIGLTIKRSIEMLDKCFEEDNDKII